MWSGPRNISTAMMRAFENRPDCAVVDEPFYAAYLAATGLDHPMREEVLASQPQDWRAVASAWSEAEPAAGLLPEAHDPPHGARASGCDWMAACRNAFLIRDPAAVLASYVAQPRRGDAGGHRRACSQRELFEREADRLGRAPPVVEGADVLADPRGALRRAVRGARHPFTRGDAELAGRRRAPATASGRRPGTPRWSARPVSRRPSARPAAPLTDDLKRIADQARPHYEALARWKRG